MKKEAILLSLACSAVLLTAGTIKSIEYNNLNKISSQVANETLQLKVGEEFSEEKINSSIKSLFKYGYFKDIKVLNDNGKIIFDFKEKPSIVNVEITGYKSRINDIKELLKILKLKKGSMYTKERIENAKKTLLTMLEMEGYINSVVEPEIEYINENAVKVTFNVNKGDEIIITKAHYYGADNLDQSDFDTVTANKEVEFLPWFFGQNDGEVKINELPIDGKRINDLYYEKGYLDANVKDPFLDIDFASNQAKLDVFIKEGEKYITDNIKIIVDKTILDPKNIYPELKLTSDHTFNIKKLRRDQKYIKTQIADKGYAYAKVDFDLQKDSKTRKVNITYTVKPGEKVYINDVKISGNARTLDRVVRRNIYLAHGDLYNLTDLKDSKSKLGRTGYFEKVDIEEKRVSSNKIDLIVKVVEGSTGSIMLGAGYGSYDKVTIEGSVSDRNIFGSGLAASLNADISSHDNKFSVSLSNPAIRDSKYSGSVAIYSKEYEINRTGYDSKKKALGFSVSTGREIVRNLRGGASYRLEKIKEDYTYEKKSTVPQKDRYKNTNYISSSITPYLNFNNTDSYLLPKNGMKLATSLEYAGIGGDSEYIKSSSFLNYFYSLEDSFELDWIFRYKTNLRMLFDNGNVNQGDSLYLGGNKTLRGYESYAFPHNEDGYKINPYKRMWSNQLELSLPLSTPNKMRWGVFYDYGMIGESNFDDIQRSATGVLFEWVSPMGPLQLSYAKPLDEEKGDKTSSFEFSIGANF